MEKGLKDPYLIYIIKVMEKVVGVFHLDRNRKCSGDGMLDHTQ